ncbi:MAG: AAA family ATPase [Clostridia bacterium]|nr:AAA family ATPase [Clostridia bacterium]
MKKIPNGVSDFEKIINQNYYYVDKTEYIEKLEEYTNTNIMFLRPRKFGKTLFTSTLEYYYDIKTSDKFEELFGETYIGKNPTSNKNRYHILKFNFAGINTRTEETTINEFKNKVTRSINSFVTKYGLDFYINPELSAEALLGNIFEAFRYQKVGEKIYVIIDEYDQFANELLGFNYNSFRELVSKNGIIRKWYEVLKEGTESVVDRVFITGVAPITLDALTSGFNNAADITRDFRFNEMMGFTKDELVKMMDDIEISKEEQEKLFPIMKENYDGYLFTYEGKERIYNSNMVLFFLNEYLARRDIPNKLIDVNIASDYEKIGKMLNLCKDEQKIDILTIIISGEGIVSEITTKFNPALPFGNKEMISMLYYLGYLTVESESFGVDKLIIPNMMMKKIYSDYFISIINEIIEFDGNINYNAIREEIATKGEITKITEVLSDYLNNLSNRDFQRFDEKNLKFMFYCLLMNLQTIYSIKSEPEIHRKYPDILLVAKKPEYYSVIIEFKYLKRSEENLLKQKQEEAKEQIKEYVDFEDIKEIPNLVKYTVVAIVDEIHVEKID